MLFLVIFHIATKFYKEGVFDIVKNRIVLWQ